MIDSDMNYEVTPEVDVEKRADDVVMEGNVEYAVSEIICR